MSNCEYYILGDESTSAINNLLNLKPYFLLPDDQANSLMKRQAFVDIYLGESLVADHELVEVEIFVDLVEHLLEILDVAGCFVAVACTHLGKDNWIKIK